MSELYAAAKRRWRGLLALSTMALLWAFVGVAARAQDEPVLHGQVQELDHVVRLQRPRTPQLQPSTAPGGVDRTNLKATVDFGDADFSHTMRQPWFARVSSPPLVGGTESEAPVHEAEQTPLTTSVDDDEMVIAWEDWHRRVCRAIYEEWTANSRVRGIAHTDLRFTRDHHIYCHITDIDVEDVELNHFPPGFGISREALEEEFAREIMNTVRAIDGSPILEFPARSRRTETSFSPYFKKMGESGYDWRKDDYERVKLN